MRRLFLLTIFFSFFRLHAEIQAEKTFLQKLWGLPPEPSIYLGMWTLHFKNGDDANWNNHAYGIEYNGYFVSSMINTYYQQCFSAGITRDWFQTRLSRNTALTFGYRLGGIYGYDHQLKSIADFAERYKVLPYGQVYTHFIYKRLRFELSYINQLISFHFALIWKKY
ncbi:MAG: hypothetical protein S4CHLAM20_09360 [Chlamydiia bacterium]|nr:hypothetical protein [Chlamydiia bacterium]